MTTLALVKGALYGFPDVWARVDESAVNDKHRELIEQLQIVTRNIFNGEDWTQVLKFNGEQGEHYKCACSQENLVYPYIVKHGPTGESVLVGSECVKKFGNEKLNADVRALKRGSICAGDNPIHNKRTADGKLGLCRHLDCHCRDPRCCYCEKFLDECICPKCPDCRKISWDCACPRCKKCRMKITAGGTCRCEICDWCEKYPNFCECEKCQVCGDYKQRCKCKKCTKCRVSMTARERYSLCQRCYSNHETMQCKNCDAVILKRDYKKLCYPCYLEKI